jgi:hypothetical protein
VATLEKQSVRALNSAMGFPMEMDRYPGGKIWVVSHNPVAVAAGLGHMGIFPVRRYLRMRWLFRFWAKTLTNTVPPRDDRAG